MRDILIVLSVGTICTAWVLGFWMARWMVFVPLAIVFSMIGAGFFNWLHDPTGGLPGIIGGVVLAVYVSGMPRQYMRGPFY